MKLCHICVGDGAHSEDTELENDPLINLLLNPNRNKSVWICLQTATNCHCITLKNMAIN